ncbi:MAG: FAD-dependent oxidoreductase [Rhodobacteraceae bacterium]|nr:FAD-dependent oxidoreductase [Paracoccaceae bacterium]
MRDYNHDVIIIGAGPAGIAVATGLNRAGISDILVLEREADIGGIPRHTPHPSFGLLVFKRPISGPAYIKKLLKRCPNVRFQTKTTVTALFEGGMLEIATPKGLQTLRARHIVLATGARETPRHPRLVSGLRPQGVMTTGALQQFLFAEYLKPCTRAVVVGTELVSFSALWALRHAGIKPLAMVESGPRIKACRPATIFARLLGVPIHYNSRVVDILGSDTLSAVVIEGADGQRQSLACDGLIFSGAFTGDNTLARASHLAMNAETGIPLIDQNWHSADSAISVVGNATHPADMGDQCYIEGLAAGRAIAAKLNQPEAATKTVVIRQGAGIKMTTPNLLRVGPDGLIFGLNLHVTQAYKGKITVKCGDEVLYQKAHSCLPTRRISLKNIRLNAGNSTPLEVILG